MYNFCVAAFSKCSNLHTIKVVTTNCTDLDSDDDTRKIADETLKKYPKMLKYDLGKRNANVVIEYNEQIMEKKIQYVLIFFNIMK